MASIISSLARLVLRKGPEGGRNDEESGHAQATGPAGIAPSNTINPDINPGSLGSFGFQSHGTPPISTGASLTMFRLMLGITSSPHLGFAQQNRPAPNIGIYARVVYAEQKSKDSFKIFSLLINCCYFLQIVVAAAVTALGAASANHNAITAFGAINTIMAGLLTFLKGSGLPARYKYYGNEWKKLREFIEAKEREFAREDCELNVYEVVDAIQLMYENVEQEVQINTPDSYTSITHAALMAQEAHGKVKGAVGSRLDGLSHKFLEHKGVAEKLASHVEKQSHAVADDLRQSEKRIELRFKDVEASMAKEVEDYTTDIQHEARKIREISQSVPTSASLQISAGAQLPRDNEHGKKVDTHE
ncbi:hypothetical protein SCAR479_13285 [Seiridium cardinale]|uniref:SMODS and SLOG-associating 2TM effector domain-containing protein n=1 Tax=Seiridium cardinale TaxID=138064 RepID=A0ABR2X8B4_9PEZI